MLPVDTNPCVTLYGVIQYFLYYFFILRLALLHNSVTGENENGKAIRADPRWESNFWRSTCQWHSELINLFIARSSWNQECPHVWFYVHSTVVYRLVSGFFSIVSSNPMVVSFTDLALSYLRFPSITRAISLMDWVTLVTQTPNLAPTSLPPSLALLT